MDANQSQLWRWNNPSGVTSWHPEDLLPLPVITLRVLLSGSGSESQGLFWVEQANLWRWWLAVFQGRVALLGLTGPLSSLLTPFQTSAKGGTPKTKGNSEGGKEVREIGGSPPQATRGSSSSPVPFNHLPARGHAISFLRPCLPSNFSWVLTGDSITASFTYCFLVCMLFHTGTICLNPKSKSLIFIQSQVPWCWKTLLSLLLLLTKSLL